MAIPNLIGSSAEFQSSVVNVSMTPTQLSSRFADIRRQCGLPKRSPTCMPSACDQNSSLKNPAPNDTERLTAAHANKPAVFPEARRCKQSSNYRLCKASTKRRRPNDSVLTWKTVR